MLRATPRQGFSLIELLVVIAIIAILIALLLPGVQKVRETAQRAHCQHNIKEMGIGLHGYHDAHGCFPPGVVDTADNQPPQWYWSWMTMTLPYLEQGALYAQGDDWMQKHGGPWFPANPALGTPVLIYSCPADSRSLVADYGVQGIPGYVAFTEYLGVSSGSSADFTTAESTGIFHANYKSVGSTTRLNDITDGASYTLMVGERPPSRDLLFGWWFAGAGWDGSGTGDVLLGAREYNYAANIGPLFSYGINCPTANVGLQPGRLDNNCDHTHFWSLHSGGTNFLMADGSVHFFPYSANAILPALSTIAGGEAVDGAAF